MTRALPNLAEAKAMARELRQSRSTAGETLSHSAALERVAKGLGYRDWNACAAALSGAGGRELMAGDRVRGRYLGQAFTGVVIRSAPAPAEPRGWLQLELHFDHPVDVVQSERFTNLRQRVRGTVGPQGFSREETSDGVPHLSVERLPDPR